MTRVYLAGPAVFRRDAQSFGEALKHRCRDLGFTPLWPLDNVPTETEPSAIARQIREMNCAMIALADFVVADISPFRGPNMDPGTAYEIGYAMALKKPVYLYSGNTQSLRDRTAANTTTHSFNGQLYDSDGMMIEDFDLAENLMIAAAVDVIHGTVDAALDAARNDFGGTR